MKGNASHYSAWFCKDSAFQSTCSLWQHRPTSPPIGISSVRHLVVNLGTHWLTNMCQALQRCYVGVLDRYDAPSPAVQAIVTPWSHLYYYVFQNERCTVPSSGGLAARLCSNVRMGTTTQGKRSESKPRKSTDKRCRRSTSPAKGSVKEHLVKGTGWYRGTESLSQECRSGIFAHKVSCHKSGGAEWH